MQVDLIYAATVFVVATAVAIGLCLFVLTVVLRRRQKLRKRLARVSRKRMSGRLDLEDARLMLLRQKTEMNAFVRVTEMLARFLPLLDTTRLRANFRRAGLEWTVATFVTFSLLVAAVVVAGAAFLTGRPFALFVVPGLLLGMFAMDRFVLMRGNARATRFMKHLPDAIDTIIRGIRSGLPVIECIGNVGQEFDEPVGGHFRAVSERVMLGEPLEQALWRVARVIDRAEMDFFATSIAIQVETGGACRMRLATLRTCCGSVNR